MLRKLSKELGDYLEKALQFKNSEPRHLLERFPMDRNILEDFRKDERGFNQFIEFNELINASLSRLDQALNQEKFHFLAILEACSIIIRFCSKAYDLLEDDCFQSFMDNLILLYLKEGDEQTEFWRLYVHQVPLDIHAIAQGEPMPEPEVNRWLNQARATLHNPFPSTLQTILRRSLMLDLEAEGISIGILLGYYQGYSEEIPQTLSIWRYIEQFGLYANILALIEQPLRAQPLAIQEELNIIASSYNRYLFQAFYLDRAIAEHNARYGHGSAKRLAFLNQNIDPKAALVHSYARADLMDWFHNYVSLEAAAPIQCLGLKQSALHQTELTPQLLEQHWQYHKNPNKLYREGLDLESKPLIYLELEYLHKEFEALDAEQLDGLRTFTRDFLATIKDSFPPFDHGLIEWEGESFIHSIGYKIIFNKNEPTLLLRDLHFGAFALDLRHAQAWLETYIHFIVTRHGVGPITKPCYQTARVRFFKPKNTATLIRHNNAANLSTTHSSEATLRAFRQTQLRSRRNSPVLGPTQTTPRRFNFSIDNEPSTVSGHATAFNSPF